MPFKNISDHAPTGVSHTKVSSNSYDPVYGRNTPYPYRFSVYVNKIPETDGSQSVVEYRIPGDLVGNRLYLWHRPLTTAAGTVTSITVSNGTLDTTATNAKQGYIVFSTLPTVNFTVSYVAAPDCISAVHINSLQDDVMELQKSVGPANLTGWPGLKNLSYGIFDTPVDANLTGVATRSVYLSHLNQNIVIGSTNDASLVASLGTQHNIQLGRATDSLTVDVTGLTITQSNALYSTRIQLGTRTGDNLTYKGTLSGAGPLIVGGPEWSIYSGVVFSTALTGSFYSGSMLRIHGDASFMGNVKAYGNITIVNTTGTTSTVMGDWTVRDELFVDGATHLNGDTDTNRLEVNNHLYVDGNIILNNQIGSSNGQSLVDNLDPSEIAVSYKTVTKKRLPYSVVDGCFNLSQVSPKLTAYSPFYSLSGNKLAGDLFTITGKVNAASGPSGEHPNVIQLNLNSKIVSGTYIGTTGTLDGVWCPGLMNPGDMWIYITQGQAAGFNAPIYGYTFQTGNLQYCLGLNVMVPELVEPRPTTNDVALIYNPNNIPYNFVGAAGGASPTFQVSGSATFPFKVAFDDEVRVMTSNTANISLSTALSRSISGQPGTVQTGIAYIFAALTGTDPENPPMFKARPVPFRMPGETVIGEVVASWNGSSWSVLDTVSYRPGGVYDSCWMPILGSVGVTQHSGRFIPQLATTGNPVNIYFQHQLGPDLNLSMSNIDLYLGKFSTTGINTGFSATVTDLFSFAGMDSRAGFGNGGFLRVPLNGARTSASSSARDASIFYLDGKLIGLQLTPGLIDGIQTGSGSSVGPTFDHLRLVMRRDV